MMNLDSLVAAGRPCFANDTIWSALDNREVQGIEDDVTLAVEQLLGALRINTKDDHNTRGTARRVARMYVHEVFRGRYYPPPVVTDFPNAKGLDEVYAVGPITVRSACSHHLVPIVGHAWIAVKPTDRVIGLSKFNRLVEWVMARPQIQEEATIMLADTIEELIAPEGLAVVVKAKHLCMTWRGVRDSSTEMTTSVMRGVFREEPEARAEVFSLLAGQGL